MTVDYAEAIAAVEVFALREVRNAPILGSLEGESQFKNLMLDMVTEIVEEHLAQAVAVGGRHVDGEDDGDGDGPRLHAWLEQRGATYTLVVLRFDHESRTPPVVTDTMAIVHGERALIGKFVVYRESRTGSIAIEHLPGGRFSDDRRTLDAPARPVVAAKPVVHRTWAALLAWWHGQKIVLGAIASSIRRRAEEIGHAVTVALPIAWLERFMRLWHGAVIERVLLATPERRRTGQAAGQAGARLKGRRSAPLASQSAPVAVLAAGGSGELSGGHLGRLHGLVPASGRPARDAGPEARDNSAGHEPPVDSDPMTRWVEPLELSRMPASTWAPESAGAKHQSAADRRCISP